MHPLPSTRNALKFKSLKMKGFPNYREEFMIPIVYLSQLVSGFSLKTTFATTQKPPFVRYTLHYFF